MQFFSVAAAALLAGSALAAPTAPAVQGRTISTVRIQFQGAADAFDDQYVPIDGNSYNVNSILSVSHIASFGPSNVNCVAKGRDNSVTYIQGYETVDVGPPQVQDSISCSAY